MAPLGPTVVPDDRRLTYKELGELWGVTAPAALKRVAKRGYARALIMYARDGGKRVQKFGYAKALEKYGA